MSRDSAYFSLSLVHQVSHLKVSRHSAVAMDQNDSPSTFLTMSILFQGQWVHYNAVSALWLVLRMLVVTVVVCSLYIVAYTVVIMTSATVIIVMYTWC